MQPKIDTKNPLVYFAYEGPKAAVNRNRIRTLKEIQDKLPREYFKVWFNEDCFIIAVEKIIDGEIVWKDHYTYEKNGIVSGTREIAGNKIALKFDDKKRIVEPVIGEHPGSLFEKQ